MIIGGGPAGYTAAIYAVRSGVRAVLFEGMQPGGQLTTTTRIENFPGFEDGVEAASLMTAMRSQAVKLGADVRSGLVTGVESCEGGFSVELDGGEKIVSKTIIIATGSSAKYLGLESEKKYVGLGVSACATCDGFFYRNKTVAVVGGGDTACEEASYLASLCSKVYMIVRRNVLRATEAMQEKVRTNPRIEILWECRTKEVLGDASGVNGVRLVRAGGEEFDISADGFFLAIGHHPNSDLLTGIVDLDAEGYIRTDGKSTATSRKGIFAAGDVQDPSYRQAIVAAGSGAKAAMDMKAYLDTLPK